MGVACFSETWPTLASMSISRVQKPRSGRDGLLVPRPIILSRSWAVLLSHPHGELSL